MKKRRKPLRSAPGFLSRKRQPDRLRRANHTSTLTSPVTRGRAARPCRRKKRHLSGSVSPDHHSSQDVDPSLPNTYKTPPTAAPDTDIGLPIVGTLNVSIVGPYAVHILYFRPNHLCWPSKPPTADPKLTIENELKSNCEYDREGCAEKLGLNRRKVRTAPSHPRTAWRTQWNWLTRSTTNTLSLVSLQIRGYRPSRGSRAPNSICEPAAMTISFQHSSGDLGGIKTIEGASETSDQRWKAYLSLDSPLDPYTVEVMDLGPWTVDRRQSQPG